MRKKNKFLKIHSIIIIINGSKKLIMLLLQYLKNRSGDTERREKNGDLFVIKNLKYSCTCIVHEKAYGEEYIQSE